MGDVGVPIGIHCIRLVDQQVVLEAEAGTGHAQCPACGTWSDRVHGWYTRRPLDLPWRGQTVRILLAVRRFRCTNAQCDRQTFAERFDSLVPPHGRRTLAATTFLTTLAEHVGGEAGARVARSAGLPVSADTLVRILRRSAAACTSAPRVLGVDDFAFRRRHRYGTILVDMETHAPIDLLTDRTADTLAAWLRDHPGVEIIVRDRAGAYAEGARAGAPNAMQVADRFHLIQNATQALEELLRSRPRRVVSVPEPDPPPIPPSGESTAVSIAEASPSLTSLSAARRRQLDRAGARIARWEEVHDRRARGQGLRQIAREMHIARMTVRRLLDRPRPSLEPVPRPPRPGGLTSPKLHPYVSHLEERWQAGCTNVRQLYRELAARGYTGSYSLLEQALRPSRPPRPPPRDRKREREPPRQLSVRWLCLRPPESLKEDERTALQQVLQQDAHLALGHSLVQHFRQLVHDRNVAALDQWLIDAEQSGIAPFLILAHGIRMDRLAVNAALTTPWSNGTVEGHVHRLKLIKRQGYGRTRPDLLRRRVVA
ncbi:MAG: ISL3 family transposase [Chloroflexi bacterium]|nr:ISL3 family transposase [Chloroflexota bacterium]